MGATLSEKGVHTRFGQIRERVRLKRCRVTWRSETILLARYVAGFLSLTQAANERAEGYFPY
jgi:hypothetical protein